ncbi:hypothetical protein ACFT4A_11650 [Streptomyces sp. NPDC057099]|uniref:hypothetical protein n=1 Tax=Streptomyces sp. NPDC057099 TaxID=3346019 RepID=UPI0036423E6A
MAQRGRRRRGESGEAGRGAQDDTGRGAARRGRHRAHRAGGQHETRRAPAGPADRRRPLRRGGGPAEPVAEHTETEPQGEHREDADLPLLCGGVPEQVHTPGRSSGGPRGFTAGL